MGRPRTLRGVVAFAVSEKVYEYEGHKFVADPPWSESLRCIACSYVTSYARTRMIESLRDATPCPKQESS